MSPPDSSPDDNALALWQHPDATHRIVLHGQLLTYCLARRPRRSIGLMVDKHGLRVHAPQRVPLAQVEALLHSKADWVLKSLQEVHDKHQQEAAQRLRWQDGMQLPYLGQALSLRLSPAHRARTAGHLLQAEHPDGPTLWLELGASATPEQLEQAVTRWLQGQARRLFTRRLDHFAPHMGVQWQRLSLSNARTRWGSASSNGAIRLNWRLIHLPPDLIDYVVVHELAHLHEMNHSPRFWAHVEKILPDWTERRRQLREAVVPL